MHFQSADEESGSSESTAEREKRLDGSKDKLTAVTDFYRLEPERQPLSADGLSVFFFKVMDAGKTAGLTNDHIAFKFLEYAPGGKKVYRDLKATIKADMTRDALLTLYDHAKEHAPTTREMKVKEEPVFVVQEEEKVPSWAKELQHEVRRLKRNAKESVSTDETSVTSTDDKVFYSMDKKTCNICKMSNHVEKDCFKRICKRCAPAAMPPAAMPPAAIPPAVMPPADMPPAAIPPAAIPPAAMPPAAMPPAAMLPAAMPPAAMPQASPAIVVVGTLWGTMLQLMPPAVTHLAITRPAAMPPAAMPPAAIPSAATPPAAIPSAATPPAAMPSAAMLPAAIPPAAMPPASPAIVTRRRYPLSLTDSPQDPSRPVTVRGNVKRFLINYKTLPRLAGQVPFCIRDVPDRPSIPVTPEATLYQVLRGKEKVDKARRKWYRLIQVHKKHRKRLKLAFETAEELLMDTANSQGCQRYDPLAYDIMDEDFHAMMDPVVAHVFNWPSLEKREDRIELRIRFVHWRRKQRELVRQQGARGAKRYNTAPPIARYFFPEGVLTPQEDVGTMTS